MKTAFAALLFATSVLAAGSSSRAAETAGVTSSAAPSQSDWEAWLRSNLETGSSSAPSTPGQGDCPAGKVLDPDTGACVHAVTTRGFNLNAGAGPQGSSGSALAAPNKSHVLNVAFALNSSTLSSSDDLLTFARQIQKPEFSHLRFEIVGYPDKSGSPSVDMKLSTDRAQAVRTFLVSHGVNSERLSATGHGSEGLGGCLVVIVDPTSSSHWPM